MIKFPIVFKGLFHQLINPQELLIDLNQLSGISDKKIIVKYKVVKESLNHQLTVFHLHYRLLKLTKIYLSFYLGTTTHV